MKLRVPPPEVSPARAIEGTTEIVVDGGARRDRQVFTIRSNSRAPGDAPSLYADDERDMPLGTTKLG
jgi:hypothetical protein